jgi:hypothetical protein
MKSIRICSALLAMLCSASSYGEKKTYPSIVSVTCQADSANDATTLNDAISEAVPGSQIQIHGTCLVNATIVLRGDMSYVGDSRTGTIIEQANGANLPAVVAAYGWYNDSSAVDSPITLAHLTINGNSAANSGSVDLVVRSWESTFEDLEIANAPSDGVLLSNPSKNGVDLAKGANMVNSRFSNLFILNCRGDGFHVNDRGSSGNNITDIDLLDSWISNPGSSAIYLDNAAGWKIRGNHVYAVHVDAIHASRCFGTAIDGNYIENFGKAGGSGTNYSGIECTVQSGPASIISNNKIFQIGGQASTGNFYFILAKLNSGTGYINVTGNTITGANANDTGLFYENTVGGSSVLNYLSANNQVQQMTTAKTTTASGTIAATSY